MLARKDRMEGRMERIKRNRIKCSHCGDIIESTHTHELKSCSCGRVSVDGGHEYVRRLFVDSPDDYTELSEWEDEDLRANQDCEEKTDT